MKSCPKCGAENRRTAAECRLCATPLSAVEDVAGTPAREVAGTEPDSAAGASNGPPDPLENPNTANELICPKCQGINESDWLFCQQCGSRLQVPDTADAMPGVAPASDHASSPALEPGEVEPAAAAEAALISQPISRVSTHLPPAPYTKPERQSPLPPDHLFEPPSAVKGDAKGESAGLNPPPNGGPQVASQDDGANQPSAQPVEPAAALTVHSDQPVRPRAGSEPLDYQEPTLCCVNCGEQLPSGAIYCASCGMKISGPGTGPTPKTQGTAVIQMITEGGQVGDTYSVSVGGIHIGRVEGEVTFPHDGYMSGRHAQIVERDGAYFLVDQNSRNGTFIRIRGEIELKPGDTFLVGKQVFRFGRK